MLHILKNRKRPKWGRIDGSKDGGGGRGLPIPPANTDTHERIWVPTAASVGDPIVHSECHREPHRKEQSLSPQKAKLTLLTLKIMNSGSQWFEVVRIWGDTIRAGQHSGQGTIHTHGQHSDSKLFCSLPLPSKQWPPYPQLTGTPFTSFFSWEHNRLRSAFRRV